MSARLTIAAYESIFSVAELRMLLNNEQETTLRISDLNGIIQAITGKVELVYEGELEDGDGGLPRSIPCARYASTGVEDRR